MDPLILIADAGSPGYAGLFADFNTTVWSAMLRIAEAMVAAAPFLVAGVFAAGLLRGMVGADRTRSTKVCPETRCVPNGALPVQSQDGLQR